MNDLDLFCPQASPALRPLVLNAAADPFSDRLKPLGDGSKISKMTQIL
jgi:hypothetical protein